MNLVPYLSTWFVLAVVVAGMAVYRHLVARHDDKSLHVVGEDDRLIKEQVQAEKRIEAIDRWGMSLTAFVIAYGLVIAGVYLYHVWQQGAKLNW